MKYILFILTFVITSFVNSQLPSDEIVESNKFNCDPRILLHYSSEDILAMDSLKFEMIKYYYCDSYILDTTNVINFDINTFDISIYEDMRKDDTYHTFTIDTINITLIPRKECVFYLNNSKTNPRHD